MANNIRTAFGVVTGPRAHWWWLHVQAPLSQKGSSGDTLARLRGHSGLAQRGKGYPVPWGRTPREPNRKCPFVRLEQRPSNVNPVYSKGGGASSNMQAPRAKGKAKVAGNEKRDVSKETCFPWNDGKCSHGPCPNGRMHNCKLCGGNHRAPDCSKNKAKGKGKASSGNGGGNGGGTRKRKARGTAGASFKK